jgi:hypothetical protein
MTADSLSISRVFGTLRLLALTLFGIILVGAATADIIWRDEPDLTTEWAVVGVAAAVAFAAAVGAVARSRRSRSASAESTNNGMKG